MSTTIRKSGNRVAPSSASKETARQFLRALKDADNPLELTEPLAPQDLLFAFFEADDEQRADLLALATEEQFHSMVDLYGWSGWTPSIEKVEELIAPLVATGLGGAIRAMDRLTDEMRTLLFRRHLVVHQREHLDDDAPEVPETSDLIPTADGYYFIEIPDAENCPTVVRQLVDGLLFRPFEEYHRELEAIRWELESSLEEDALRWRTGRMADLGFGTYEEGLRLLAPLDPSAVAARLKSRRTTPLLRVDNALPALYREKLEGHPLLEGAFSLLATSADPQWQARAETLPAEIASMTNLFLSAIRCDLSDLDAVAAGAGMARDLLALGLSAVGGNGPSDAANALVHEVPGTFIQAAMGVLTPLRQRARQLKKSPSLRTVRLDPVYHVALDCLSRDIPVWWPPLSGPEALSPAFPEPLSDEMTVISSGNDVTAAARMLDELERLEELFEQPGWLPADGAAALLSSVVLTVLANGGGGAPSCEPLDADDAEQFALQFCDRDMEEALADALAVLAPLADIDEEGPLEPAHEDEPLRRALLRLLCIGRERMVSEPATALIAR